METCHRVGQPCLITKAEAGILWKISRQTSVSRHGADSRMSIRQLLKLFRHSAKFTIDSWKASLCLQGALDNINLFSIITIMSFFLLAPFTLAKEGFQLTHQGLSSIGVANTNYIFRQALYAALSFHTYQQVSIPISDCTQCCSLSTPCFHEPSGDYASVVNMLKIYQWFCIWLKRS